MLPAVDWHALDKFVSSISEAEFGRGADEVWIAAGDDDDDDDDDDEAATLPGTRSSKSFVALRLVLALNEGDCSRSPCSLGGGGRASAIAVWHSAKHKKSSSIISSSVFVGVEGSSSCSKLFDAKSFGASGMHTRLGGMLTI
jgi:hypothetical protein